MQIVIDMLPDETCKARDAAIEVLSKLAPYDRDVAKALEGMLTDDYIGRLPEAVRALVASAAGVIEDDLEQIAALARTP